MHQRIAICAVTADVFLTTGIPEHPPLQPYSTPCLSYHIPRDRQPLKYIEHCYAHSSVNTMECIGALDQGTQSTRFLIYDREAKVIARHQVEFTQITPKPGCVAPPYERSDMHVLNSSTPEHI